MPVVRRYCSVRRRLSGTALIEEKFPALLSDARVLSERYAKVEEEIIKLLGLEDISPRQITMELLSIKRHFEVVLESMSEGILEITPEA